VSWFRADDYWLSRLLFQRGLAAIYLVAFLVAVNQFRALLGSDGILPIPRFVARVPFRRSPACSTGATRTGCSQRLRGRACSWPR
jgi:hypothetical protein